jgi:hypothetical protein
VTAREERATRLLPYRIVKSERGRMSSLPDDFPSKPELAATPASQRSRVARHRSEGMPAEKEDPESCGKHIDGCVRVMNRE